MAVSLGAHIGQQNMTMDELRSLWRELDAAGLDWLSLWDHFYEAPPAGGKYDHFEAVAALGAMAADTSNARLGCLVFYVGYRNPAMLAKAAVTLDHISGGRFELGIGGGWHEWEAEAYGYDFPSVGTRLRMLDDAAQLTRKLFDLPEGQRADHSGEFYSLTNNSFLPAPVHRQLPLWIGGLGENKTLRTTAKYADGWNAAYVGPDKYAHLNGVLDRWCEAEGRDPASIERSVNLVFALGADDAAAQEQLSLLEAEWGPMAERVRAGTLQGTPDQAAEQVAAYIEAGADMVNIALRAPFDRDALTAYVQDVVPVIRAS